MFDTIDIIQANFSGFENMGNIGMGFTVIDSMFLLTYQTYDVSYSCYNGVIEAVMTFIAYGNFFTDYTLLTTNLLFNFGLMYDSVKDAVMYFTGDERGHASDSFEAGFELGQVVYYLLFNQDEEIVVA